MKRLHLQRLQCLDVPHIVTRCGRAVYVDQTFIEELNKYRWFILKSSAVGYVVAKVQTHRLTRYIRLHSLLTHCPKTLQVHHVDRNPLNNRLVNLYVVCPENHKMLHQHLSRIITRQVDKLPVTSNASAKDRATVETDPSVAVTKRHSFVQTE